VRAYRKWCHQVLFIFVLFVSVAGELDRTSDEKDCELD
jgi:hypothetical protein